MRNSRDLARVVLLLVTFCAWSAKGQEFSWPDFSQQKNPPEMEKLREGVNELALVVGVEDYPNLPNSLDVPGAAKNARDWMIYLTQVRGIRLGNFTLLLDKEATRENILREARRLAAKAAESSDVSTLWFVFIGHGAPSKEEGMLVGMDVLPTAQSILDRSVRQSELLDALSLGQQKQTVVIIDACFNGRASNVGEAIVPGLQPLLPIAPVPPVPSRLRENLTVLSAATADQYAGPLPNDKRPAFSYLLLGGMRGWADAQGDGQVTSEEAVTYVNKAFDTLVKDRQQTPQLVVGRPDHVLARGATERGPDLVAMAVGRPHGAPAASAGCPEAGTAECVALCKKQLRAPAQDKSHAANCFLRTCDAGNMEGCNELARLYDTGEGVPQDPQRALDLHLSACDSGYLEACYHVGVHYMSGTGVVLNLKQASASLRKACEGNVASACLELGGMYLEGRGVLRDVNEAAKAFQQACAAGSATACNRLALLYGAGEGGLKNLEEAVKLHHQACNSGELWGCHNLALYHLTSNGVRKSVTTAEELFNQACEGGLPEACTERGKLYLGSEGLSRNTELAVKLFTRACEAKDGWACHLLGELYYVGREVAHDAARATQLFQKSCSLGIQADCRRTNP